MDTSEDGQADRRELFDLPSRRTNFNRVRWIQLKRQVSCMRSTYLIHLQVIGYILELRRMIVDICTSCKG